MLKNAQNVSLLELRLQAARRLLERADRVLSEGLMNKTDYEKAQDDVKIAELELKNARATTGLEADTASFEVREAQLQTERQASAVAELQRQVDRLAIEAPFDGMVASVSVQDRDAVASNAPILTVVNLDPVRDRDHPARRTTAPRSSRERARRSSTRGVSTPEKSRRSPPRCGTARSPAPSSSRAPRRRG